MLKVVQFHWLFIFIWVSTFSTANLLDFTPQLDKIDEMELYQISDAEDSIREPSTNQILGKQGLKSDLFKALMELRTLKPSGHNEFILACIHLFDDEQFCTRGLHVVDRVIGSNKLLYSRLSEHEMTKVGNGALIKPFEDSKVLNWAIDSALKDPGNFARTKQRVEEALNSIEGIQERHRNIPSEEFNVSHALKRHTGNSGYSPMCINCTKTYKIVKSVGHHFLNCIIPPIMPCLDMVGNITRIIIEKLSNLNIALSGFRRKATNRVQKRGFSLASSMWMFLGVLKNIFAVALGATASTASILVAVLVSVARLSLVIALEPEFYIILMGVAVTIVSFRKIQSMFQTVEA